NSVYCLITEQLWTAMSYNRIKQQSPLASKNFENKKIVLNAKIGKEDLLFVLSSTINIALSSTIDVFEFYQICEEEKEQCLSMHRKIKILCEKFV
ncbi:hypothetical protein, partial [Vibrio vulnificus]|uniref:hypothetical protein n=1 Tax=Vibrio vulnificus TaxID=672 RepID=UPI0019D4ABCA